MAENNLLIRALIEQRDGIRDWIDSEADYATADQGHLVESSTERAYWHHGYQSALDDIVRHLTASDPSDCSVDRPN